MNWDRLGIIAIIIAVLLTAAVELTKKINVIFSEIYIPLSNIF